MPASWTEPSTTQDSSSPNQFKALGNKVTEAELEIIRLSKRIDIEFTSDEVTAVCPVTGQPDQYTVVIALPNSEVSIESKSLKLYLQSFRNKGIFAEELAITISKAVANLVENKWSVYVTVTQKSRGGITLRAMSFEENAMTYARTL